MGTIGSREGGAGEGAAGEGAAAKNRREAEDQAETKDQKDIQHCKAIYSVNTELEDEKRTVIVVLWESIIRKLALHFRSIEHLIESKVPRISGEIRWTAKQSVSNIGKHTHPYSSI